MGNTYEKIYCEIIELLEKGEDAKVQKDAVYWYKRYLECIPGDTDAMFRISICLTDFLDKFFDVQITKEMYEEAYRYAVEAVENGHIGARVILARFYEMGIIVNQDFQKSYDLIKSAADNGEDFARGLLKRYKKNILGKYIWYS